MIKHKKIYSSTLYTNNLFLLEQVSWYRIFARSAAGSNVKVRLNDCHINGTGLWVKIFT